MTTTILEKQQQTEFLQIADPNKIRLLYTNPVCLLTTSQEKVPHFKKNIMTISWLTPIDNKDKFLCSMNKKRFSATHVKPNAEFVLNVPVQGMEALVRRIGSCSGFKYDKFAVFGSEVTFCAPGNDSGTHNVDHVFAILECCAHMVCVMERIEETEDHWIIFARISDAYVKPAYWKDKKCFVATSDQVPSYLTFLGSQQFAYVKL